MTNRVIPVSEFIEDVSRMAEESLRAHYGREPTKDEIVKFMWVSLGGNLSDEEEENESMVDDLLKPAL